MRKYLFPFIAAVVGIPPAAVRFARNLGKQVVLAANAFTPSVHKKVITKFTGSAIASRWLVGKQSGATTVGVAGFGDRAQFVFTDAPQALDITLDNPAPVGVIMLGATDESIPMVAGSGGINVGDVVYPAPGGQVDTYAHQGSSGTNFPCGIVVANPSTQQGDIIEVQGLLSVNSAAL